MPEAKSNPSQLEWFVGALGGLIFLFLIGVTVSSAIRGGDAPPTIITEVVRIQKTHGGYVVEFDARNTGDITGAGVRLVATLSVGGRAVEQHEVELDYLPRGSSQRGGFVFQTDPNKGALKIDADGYTDP
ncbi:MAG: hypothetical protein ABWZ40_12110 [Caulobacterales bacterium]